MGCEQHPRDRPRSCHREACSRAGQPRHLAPRGLIWAFSSQWEASWWWCSLCPPKDEGEKERPSCHVIKMKTSCQKRNAVVVGETCGAKCGQLCRKTCHWVSPVGRLPASQLLAAPPEPTPPASARRLGSADLKLHVSGAPPLCFTQGHGSGSICLQKQVVREVHSAAAA